MQATGRLTLVTADVLVCQEVVVVLVDENLRALRPNVVPLECECLDK